MINNYRCFTLSCPANVNIVQEIEKILKQEGWKFENFALHFVGFQAEEGKTFLLNGKQMKIPKGGNFITPFDGTQFLEIASLQFNTALYNQDFYCIY